MNRIFNNLMNSGSILILTNALVAAFGAAGCSPMNNAAQNSTNANAATTTNAAQANQPMPTNQTAPNAAPVASYSAVVKRVTPAVVTIQSARRARALRSNSLLLTTRAFVSFSATASPETSRVSSSRHPFSPDSVRA